MSRSICKAQVGDVMGQAQLLTTIQIILNSPKALNSLVLACSDDDENSLSLCDTGSHISYVQNKWP